MRFTLLSNVCRFQHIFVKAYIIYNICVLIYFNLFLKSVGQFCGTKCVSKYEKLIYNLVLMENMCHIKLRLSMAPSSRNQSGRRYGVTCILQFLILQFRHINQ